ncbi:MAG: M23 family metallopeptidase, partial [Acidimicrobiia bacterium]
FVIVGASLASAAVDGSDVIAVGNAPDRGSLLDRNIRPVSAVLGLDSDATGEGYWMVAGDGGIFSFGDAPFFGSTGSTKLNKPMVGMAPTPSGQGYWMFAGDGGIFAFGDAGFFGSLGSTKLNGPIVAMTPTATGKGYLMVGSDGGVFTFGDAQFLGSTGGSSASPIVDMATMPTGAGYWIVTEDGTVYPFGAATLHGDLRDKKLSNPVVGIAVSPSGNGYWLAQQDGQVWAFGDASTAVAAPARCLTQPVVGIAARPQGDGVWLATAPLPPVSTTGLSPLDALDAINGGLEQRVRLAQGCQSAVNVESLTYSDPLPGARLSSPYGNRIHPVYKLPQFHRGIDLAGGTTAIRAIADGKVIEVSSLIGYGITTVIDHGGKISSVYGHQSATRVKAGDEVKAGQTIGTVGQTGYATGPHLHMEIRSGGVVVDPTPFLRP